MITIPLFKVIKNDNFCLYLLKNLHFMEAEIANNISDSGYILGGIAAKAIIACIIAFIISRINEKYTFKGTFPKALLALCLFSLLMGLFRLALYNNSDYPYNYPPNYLDRIITNIIVNILCIGISLVIIYNKPKKDEFAEIDQTITNNLNHFELTSQKSLQNKEHLKNALQSGLITQSEYDEKLKQIEAQIEKEHQITDRIKEHQAKVEKLRILEQKKEDLVNLYNNNILTQEEYHKKLEEITKEKNTYVADINKELEFINNFMNKINEENKVREDDKKSVKNLIKEKNEKLAILRKQYLFRTIDESTYNKKLKELDEEYDKKI